MDDLKGGAFGPTLDLVPDERQNVEDAAAAAHVGQHVGAGDPLALRGAVVLIQGRRKLALGGNTDR